MKSSITAFFPAYNDQHTIGSLVRTAASELRKITDDFEIVVVNDGSQDHTAEVLQRAQHEIRELRIIHHPRNLGYGAALISGFTNARKELIFCTDGDGQYDVREMHNLVKVLRPDVDFVTGYKIRRADALHRVWIGETYRLAMRLFFNLVVSDVDCDFRLFRRNILEHISLQSDSGVICVELVRKVQLAGYRIVEVPVTHWPRRYGTSQFFCFRHLSRVFGGLFKIWSSLVLGHHLQLGISRLRQAPSAQVKAAKAVGVAGPLWQALSRTLRR
jgi:glycosyltransferase involved in cell wall biosynthesis